MKGYDVFKLELWVETLELGASSQRARADDTATPEVETSLHINTAESHVHVLCSVNNYVTWTHYMLHVTYMMYVQGEGTLGGYTRMPTTC